jgi:N-acyl amino acid synthase of PEP-CTERM/exosortase system
MFEFKRAETPEELRQVRELRYQVYIVERGYERPEDHPDGLERDEFDASSDHFLCLDPEGIPVGTVRLIRHSSLGFPIERHCDVESPAPAEILARTAEISRLAVSRLYRRRAGDTIYGLTEPQPVPHPMEERRGLPILFMGLLREVYQTSLRTGITHWYAAMERQLSVLLRRFCFNFRRVGPVVPYHGDRAPYLVEVRDVERRVGERHPHVLSFFREGLEPELTAEAVHDRAAGTTSIP